MIAGFRSMRSLRSRSWAEDIVVVVAGEVLTAIDALWEREEDNGTPGKGKDTEDAVRKASETPIRSLHALRVSNRALGNK